MYLPYQGQIFYSLSLASLPHEIAERLIRRLYAPEERFSQGFLRYRLNTLKQDKVTALAETQAESERYIDYWCQRLHDPYVHTIGFDDAQGQYQPIGFYALRPLAEHPRGLQLAEVLDHEGGETYSGNRVMVHSLSILEEWRDLQLLKFAFVLIADECRQKNAPHILFYMSDHRLKRIYQRYGLDFPAFLTFSDSQHAVGCYSLTPENLAMVESGRISLGVVDSKPADWLQVS